MIYPAAAVLALVLVGWLVSLARKDASVVDSLWGPGFTVIAWTGYTQEISPRAWIVLLLVTLWGLRLGAYLTYRNHGRPEDHRYAAMRARHRPFWLKSLYIVFLFQGALMLIIGSPLVIAMSSSAPLGPLDMVGATLFAVGFSFEVVGDEQLRRFLLDPTHDGKVMDRGLWRYTRHPNYFGDATLWWGLACFAFSTGAWWCAYAPALMTFFLLRVSGVTLLESTLPKRRPEYTEYMKRTSAFIPWPPR